MFRFLIIATVFLALPSFTIAAGFDAALREATPTKKYLLYLHDENVETQGKNASSTRYGVYAYDRIINHFEDRGLTVIEELRPKVDATQYAAKISMRIRQLKAAGVPSSNITVAGFSKGGFIALLVASSLNDPGVGYVVMAGCGSNAKGFAFDQFLKRKRGSRLTGRILSLYASSDIEAGSCRPAIEQASGKGLQFREQRIKTGKGHGLFYQPRPDWIEPTAIFAKGGR